MSLDNLNFRAWDKGTELMNDVTVVDLENEEVYYHHWRYGHSKAINLKDIELMQSTGLKDKNDVEIFEGDILKGPMDFGPAGFIKSVAPVSYHKINGYQLHYFLLEHTEVIGNVYEDKNIKFGIVEE